MDSPRFEELEFEQQIEVVKEKSFDQKGELILKSHHPEQLVPSLPPEEFFLVYQATHAELIPDLISYANPTQLVFIADLECWREDQIHPKKFLQWLRYLYDAGPEKLLQWLGRADFEMVVAAFKPHLGVLKLAPPEEEIDEILGDHPYFTVDGYYYCLVKEEELELLKRSLEFLFGEDKAFYIQLMEGLISELQAESEVEASRLRQERLAEEGFPEKEEAYRIYRPLSKEEWDHLPKEKFASGIEPIENAPFLVPTLGSLERLFFDDAFTIMLTHATPQQRDYLQLELTHLSNKAIVCSGTEFSNEQRIRESIQRVCRYLSIALEELSDRDLEKAGKLIGEHWLEHLFRWGNSSVLSLRDVAEEILGMFWKGKARYLYPLMGGPYGEILQGVLRTHPQFYDPTVRGSLSPLRDFRSLNELHQTLNSLTEIRQFFVWFGFHFPDWIQQLPLIRRKMIHGVELNIASMVGTCLAHWIIEGAYCLNPLSLEELRRFFRAGFQGKPPQRKLKEEVKERFRSQSPQGTEIFLPDGFCQWIFRECEIGLGGLSPDQELDPRFISGVLISART